MKNSIAILLSTYNGESFLTQQIDSILKQDYSDWILYIRDDGSKDSTLDIIKNYCRLYDNIIFLNNDNDNKGAALSFMHMLFKVNANYYMFCDQDDIWLENKISSLYNVISRDAQKEGNPMLVFSDAKVVDQNLKLISSSLWNHDKTPPSLIFSNRKYVSVFNCAPGCTMIFNKKLKELLTDYDKNLIMHDWYVLIKAIQYGKVEYITNPLILYRQHQNNVLGAHKASSKDHAYKLLKYHKTLKSQIKAFKFVRKYTNINIFEFFILKFKFNLLRFK